MHNTDLELAKQITSASDSLYLKGIERRQVKFLGIPSLNIIQHLYYNYVMLNQVDIYYNEKKMS